MNAPPGVDSDSSSGEESDSSPYSPKKPGSPPHFSLKALFTPAPRLGRRSGSKTIKKPQASPKQVIQETASSSFSAPEPRPPSPIKRKVRIHVDGEDHPDAPIPKIDLRKRDIDLLASPAPSQHLSIGDTGSPWGRDPDSPLAPRPGEKATGKSKQSQETSGGLFGSVNSLLGDSIATRPSEREAMRMARIESIEDENPENRAKQLPATDNGPARTDSPQTKEQKHGLNEQYYHCDPPHPAHGGITSDSADNPDASQQKTEAAAAQTQPPDSAGPSVYKKGIDTRRKPRSAPSEQVDKPPFSQDDQSAIDQPTGPYQANRTADDHAHPFEQSNTHLDANVRHPAPIQPQNHFAAPYPAGPWYNHPPSPWQTICPACHNLHHTAHQAMPAAHQGHFYPSPPQPPQYPHPQALQPWQPYYPPFSGWPYDPHSQPVSPNYQPGQNSTPAHQVNQRSGDFRSPLTSLPNPWEISTGAGSESTSPRSPRLQSDGLVLRPAPVEAKSLQMKSPSRLPGSRKRSVLHDAGAEPDQAPQTKKSNSKSLETAQGRHTDGERAKEPIKSNESKAQNPERKLQGLSDKPNKVRGEDVAGAAKGAKKTEENKEKDKSSSSPSPSQESAKPSPEVREKLGKINLARAKIKERLADGSMSSDVGSKELERLGKTRDQLMKSIQSKESSEDQTKSVKVAQKKPDELKAPPKQAEGRPAETSSPPEATSGVTKERADASSSLSKDPETEAKLKQINKQLAKISEKVNAGEMSEADGQAAVKKLQKARLALSVRPGDEEPQSAGSETKTEPKSSKQELSEEQTKNLAAITSRMKRVKTKVTEGSITKEEAQKELAKLSKAREELIGGGATGPKKSATAQSKDAKDESNVERTKSGDKEDLDPEILKQVLEDTAADPERLKPSASRSKSKPKAGRDKADIDKARDAAKERHDMVVEEKQARKASDRDERPVSPHMVIPGSWSGSRPAEQRRPEEVTSRAVRPAKANEHLTWSKCLVSLAHCIDIGQELLAHLAERNRLRGTSEQSSVMAEVVPRLLTSLFMQRNVLSSMSGVLGEEHAQSMSDFMGHIMVIRRFFEELHERQTRPTANTSGSRSIENWDESHAANLEQRLSQSFEIGSIQAVLEHFLNLSEFITPQIREVIRHLLDEWKTNGLSLSVLIHAVITLREEFRRVSHEKELGLPNQGEYEQPRGISELLGKMLSALSFDHKTNHRKSLPPPSAAAEKPEPDSRRDLSTRSAPDQLNEMTPERKTSKHKLKEKLSNVLHVDDSPPTAEGTTLRQKEERQRGRSIKTDQSLAQVQDEPTSATEGEILLKDAPPPRKHITVSTPEPDENVFANEGIPNNRHRERYPHQLDHEQEVTVVPPPGPSFDAPGSHHHVEILEHHPKRPLSRQESSVSRYSVESLDTEGTIESDAEAEVLLAHADSGPAPVVHELVEEVKKSQRSKK